jgi:hypothetical protein
MVSHNFFVINFLQFQPFSVFIAHSRATLPTQHIGCSSLFGMPTTSIEAVLRSKPTAKGPCFGGLILAALRNRRALMTSKKQV